MSSKKEIWKKVDFKGKKPSVCYMVSNLGHFGVKNADGKIEVRKFKPQNGVYRYNFKINGEQKTLFVHKEVAKAFLPKSSPKKSMLIHKDHNYLNDSAVNLKWVTPEEHRQHVIFSPNAIRSRKKRAYTESPTSKIFNEKKVIEVKKLIWDPKRKLTFKQIAAKYKVSEMQIYRIKSGELWFHVKVAGEPENKRYKQNLQNLQQLKKTTVKKARTSVSKSRKNGSKRR